MTNRGGQRTYWRFFEGVVSVSVSMWFAIALNQCAVACAGWPLLGLLTRLASSETGIIVVATALLLPTAALLYGGMLMILAAIDTYEKWARARDAKVRAKGREEGREEGRKEGRRQIVALLEEYDVQLPPEVLRRLNGDGDSD